MCAGHLPSTRSLPHTCPLPTPASRPPVGNFSGGEAIELLAALRRAAGERAMLLLGADQWKRPATLLAAYHDPQGGCRAAVEGRCPRQSLEQCCRRCCRSCSRARTAAARLLCK